MPTNNIIFCTGQKKIVPTLPFFSGEGRRLDLTYCNVDSHDFQPSYIHKIVNFLANLSVAPRSDTTMSGVTWLELYLVFLLRGGSTNICLFQLNREHSPINLMRLLKGFQCSVRHTVRCMCSTSDRVFVFLSAY